MTHNAGDIVIRIRADALNVDSKLRRTERNIEGFARRSNANMKRFDQYLLQVTKRVVAFTAAYVGLHEAASQVTKVFETAIYFERMEKALENASGSAKQAANDLNFLRQESEKLGLVLRDQITNYARVSAGAREIGLSVKETRDLFKGLSYEIAAAQLTASQANSVFLATAQVLGKNRVQAEEARKQMGQHLPGAVVKIAKSLKMSVGELDDAMRKGEISATRFARAMGVYFVQMSEERAMKAAHTAQAEINRFRTAVDELRVAIGKSGALDLFTETVVSLTKAVKLLTPDIKNATTSIIYFFKALQIAYKTAAQAREMLDNPLKYAFERMKEDAPGEKEAGKIAQYFNKVKKSFSDWWKGLRKDPYMDKFFSDYEKLFKKVGKGIKGTVKDVGPFEDAIKDLTKLYEEYNTQIEKNKTNLEGVKKAMDDISDMVVAHPEDVAMGAQPFEYLMRPMAVVDVTRQEADVQRWSNYFIEQGEYAATTVEQTFSDVLYDSLVHQFENINDIWKALGNSMIRVAADTVAKIAMEFIGLQGIIRGVGSGLLQGIGSALGFSVAGAALGSEVIKDAAMGFGTYAGALLVKAAPFMAAAYTVNSMFEGDTGSSILGTVGTVGLMSGNPIGMGIGAAALIADAFGAGDAINDLLGVGKESKPMLTTGRPADLVDLITIAGGEHTPLYQWASPQLQQPMAEIQGAIEEQLVNSINALPSILQGKVIENLENRALEKGIMMAVEGTDPNQLLSIWSEKLTYITEKSFEIAFIDALEEFWPLQEISGTIAGVDFTVPILPTEEQLQSFADRFEKMAGSATGGIQTAMIDALTAQDFGSFEDRFKQAIYDATLAGIVDAFIQSAAIQGPIEQMFGKLSGLIEASTSGGVVDWESVSAGIPSILSGVDQTLKDMEPIFDILSATTLGLQGTLGVGFAGEEDLESLLGVQDAQLTGSGVINVYFNPELIADDDPLEWLMRKIQESNVLKEGQEVNLIETTEAGVQ